ncbi:glycosyltransferase [Winogradskyella sp.]|uniref:glycosyltransferase n=1 Tax=Winogradskyella sp. TaxID=1883156 RepID=UPI00261B659B|nr:glycosyltransferase [Winogradskyella sp.]
MIRVLQIIDTLNTGGAERLAVNYANGLTQSHINSHLCATRYEGPLLESLEDEVGYIFLNRKSTLDFSAVFRLRSYISKNKINIIHAHSSSFFIGTLLKISMPRLKLIWHDHYGNSEFLDKRPIRTLKFCSLQFSKIFSVNKTLETWAKHKLWCKDVEYIKNFPVLKTFKNHLTKLKGEEGKRILCLANLREQKNHVALLEAFKLVKNDYPDWTLHCVGKDFKDDYSALFFSEIKRHELQEHVFFYDSKSDILNILQQTAIGILVSKSEGLPLAMLEYGLGGLPVICTNVGDCGLLIPDSSYGILLHDDSDENIAKAIKSFIKGEAYRKSCAKKFSKLIFESYSKGKIIDEVITTYKSLI